MAKFSFEEISPKRWSDFEKLFGDNGACGGCWCQSWRCARGGQLWNQTKGIRAKRLTKKLIGAGEMTGLLAYHDGRAVGWCSYGPRTVFPRTETMKAYRHDNIDSVWSINCFFIDKNYRRQGLSRQMLEAALKFLKKRSVGIVEAYPVPLTKKGKQLPAAFAYTGPLTIFQQAGFKIVQRLSYSRPLVQIQL